MRSRLDSEKSRAVLAGNALKLLHGRRRAGQDKSTDVVFDMPMDPI
jgi:hypothetical protein